MSFRAYLDSVQAKTGKTVAEFHTESADRGLTRHGEIVTWLRGDDGLGRGHAVADALLRAGRHATVHGPPPVQFRLIRSQTYPGCGNVLNVYDVSRLAPAVDGENA
ncbi:DUF4287 domain-containing protein [Deinococcus sp. RIT780]|uniref:DUF4287 domain-containing protein n=1 Tax=Deinococcus sp. RIT780 TaxID=2870472 RepID=UPI001C8AFDD5|nr:DUF4287 domain-containing protein [Deinococcus sp. RIT780]MBX8465840.1 DUF4287 domain-containing protein [Deinococcus sp. RIT780]